MRYYISDTHFNHANIIAFDNRPFKSVEEMNETLIQNWNSVVQNDDEIYILGDFHWGKAKEWPSILERLNGQKVLIRGNHDLKLPFTPECRKHFADVKDYKEIVDGDRHIVLCHYPIPTYKNLYHGWYHLYGHVHTTAENNMADHFFKVVSDYYELPRRAFNVGCMMPYMNYTPRTLDEIIAGAQGQ